MRYPDCSRLSGCERTAVITKRPCRHKLKARRFGRTKRIHRQWSNISKARENLEGMMFSFVASLASPRALTGLKQAARSRFARPAFLASRKNVAQHHCETSSDSNNHRKSRISITSGINDAVDAFLCILQRSTSNLSKRTSSICGIRLTRTQHRALR